MLSGSFVLTREVVDLSSICPSSCSDAGFTTAFVLEFFSRGSFLLATVYSNKGRRKNSCSFIFTCDDFVVTFDEDFYYGFLNRVVKLRLKTH
jgi:hypothetical protein